ncbi:MAG: CHAT domain-containing protein [Saprospiraceae bacterium]
MNKLILTIFLTTMLMSVFGQTTDFEKDTTQANQYYQQALGIDNVEKAIKLLEKSVKLYESHPFCKTIIEIKSYWSYLLIIKNAKKSGQIAEEAIRLAEEHNIPRDDKMLEFAYIAFINVYCTGKPIKSLEYGELVLKTIEKPSVNYFDVLNELGKSTIMTSDISRLNDLLSEMEGMLKQTSDSSFLKYYVPFYILKGIVSNMEDDYQKSIIYSKKAIIANETYIFFSDNIIKAEYVNISKAYFELNNPDESQKWLSKYVNEVDTVGFDAINLYYHYSKITSLYQMIGDLDKAFFFNNKEIEVLLPYEESQGGLLRQTYYRRATLHSDLKEYEKAEKFINKSLQYEKSMASYFIKIRILIALEKFDEGLELVQFILSELIPNFNPNSIDENPFKHEITSNYSIRIQGLLGEKARLFYKKSQVDSTNRLWLLKQSIAANELFLFARNYYLHFSSISPTGKFCYTCSYEIGLTIVQNEIYSITQKEEDLNKLFEYIEKYKAKFLIETLQKGSLPEDLRNQKKEINETLDYYEFKMKLATKDSLPFFEEKYIESTRILEKFSKKVEKEHPKSAIFLNNMKLSKVKDIQKMLSKNQIVISYAYTPANILAFLITADKKKTINISIETNPVQNINELVQLLKNPLIIQKAKRERFIELSHQLYQTLIAPIEEEIKEKKTLSFILSGELFHLPIEVLLASDEKKDFEKLDFLIKKYEINYHYSATAYSLLKDRPAFQNRSLLAFAPVFDKEQNITSTGLRSLDLPEEVYHSIENDGFLSLPNSKEEVQTIAKILEKAATTILLEKEATKKNLIQAIRKKPYQFLHIATHSIVNISNPKLSALACYTKNKEANDDLFFANEIQMENVQADLVVLSSCESGIGRLVEGEGLIALNRSFIYSGARNVLSSLWKVNDRYSRDLMVSFYKNYTKTPSYTTSLRQAKLELLQNPITANPRFWAAFVLMGE